MTSFKHILNLQGGRRLQLETLWAPVAILFYWKTNCICWKTAKLDYSKFVFHLLKMPGLAYFLICKINCGQGVRGGQRRSNDPFEGGREEGRETTVARLVWEKFVFVQTHIYYAWLTRKEHVFNGQVNVEMFKKCPVTFISDKRLPLFKLYKVLFPWIY